MEFAYWHPTIFPLQLSICSLLSTFERLLLRTPSCFLVLITELWQMFPRLIWDGRRQPSVLRTARSHLCVQWSAKPCSDICHPSTRPRIQGMYQICQSALHPNASQPPLISKRCYSSVCDIWSLIDVRSNMISPPWGNNKSQFWDLNLSWFQAGHYCPATMLQKRLSWKNGCEKCCIYIFTYHQTFVWRTLFFLSSCIIAFTLTTAKFLGFAS